MIAQIHSTQSSHIMSAIMPYCPLPLEKQSLSGSTVSRIIHGIQLRGIRRHFFGSIRPGRPRKRDICGIHKTWDELLMDQFGISNETARNWMKMAEAIMPIAEQESPGFCQICEKPPWDWTLMETRMISAAVTKLSAAFTMREIIGTPQQLQKAS